MRRSSVAAAVLVLAAFVPPAGAKTLRVCDDVVDPVTLDPRRQFSEKNYTIIR
ncbi:MAG: hypothetical protein HY079_13945, partial [Elusimicrobia bacterium]|nr:hypothetical protein [Elusimicrobiota bacterium]